MNLGVQYYRPPFPVDRFWEDDFKKIKDSGLNTVQLWVLWSWVEATPGEFRFEDYDKLVALAEKNELGLVLSTISELQPCWIHREVPGSEMINNFGQKVVSSNRCECHFGLTPGGCTDHPGVWQRMTTFFNEVVTRYRGSSAIVGWDAWNELRWNVQADSLVCYCDHTLAAFRKWLDEKYGGLDGLNETWLRRYSQWDDVRPGKLTGNPYTEQMAFEHYTTVRSNIHAKARYDIIKSLDPSRPVTVHGGSPTILTPADEHASALDRGNDWFFADELDGVGCSSFPKWFGHDDADFGMRVECVKSAARDKEVWLSEVQGGRSSQGFEIYDSVDALSQQRWIWNGLACGADTILFWCWRDEIFGRESGGYGLIGADGLAEERLAAMKVTGKTLETHTELFDNYKPAEGNVGIFFSPQTYYLYWAHEANVSRPMNAMAGYARCMVRNSIPYKFIEEEHLDELETIKILFMPRTTVLTDKAKTALQKFVNNGGTIVCESECGGFSDIGLYSYAEDRFIADLTGVYEVGRRKITSQTIEVNLDGKTVGLTPDQWLTPFKQGEYDILAECEQGPLIVEKKVGQGRVVMCGSYFGNGYQSDPGDGFEEFVRHFVTLAGCAQYIKVLAPARTQDDFVYIKNGWSNDKLVVFVFFPQDTPEVTLELADGLFQGEQLKDIISGRNVEIIDKRCSVKVTDIGVAILAE